MHPHRQERESLYSGPAPMAMVRAPDDGWTRVPIRGLCHEIRNAATPRLCVRPLEVSVRCSDRITVATRLHI